MSDLTVLPKFTSIDLTWSAPQEPNGVIISYEVTYRVTGSNLVTTNTTDFSTTFSISSLTPQTTVSDISVSAYTSIGQGEVATIADQTTREEPREFFVINPQRMRELQFSLFVCVCVCVFVCVTYDSGGYADLQC